MIVRAQRLRGQQNESFEFQHLYDPFFGAVYITTCALYIHTIYILALGFTLAHTFGASTGAVPGRRIVSVVRTCFSIDVK